MREDADGADCGRYRGTRRSRRFPGLFEDLPDPRQRGKVLYPLDEVLLQLSFLITCSLQHRELMAQDNKFQQEVKALADVIFP